MATVLDNQSYGIGENSTGTKPQQNTTKANRVPFYWWMVSVEALTGTSHERHGVLNHRQLNCLFDNLFMTKSNKTLNLCYLLDPCIKGSVKQNVPCRQQMAFWNGILFMSGSIVTISTFLTSKIHPWHLSSPWGVSQHWLGMVHYTPLAIFWEQ